MWMTKRTTKDLLQSVLKRWKDHPILYVGSAETKILQALGDNVKEVRDNSTDRIQQQEPHFPKIQFSVAPDFQTSQLSLENKTVLIGNILTDMDDIWAFLRGLRNQAEQSTRFCILHTSYFWQPLIRFFQSFGKKTKNKKPSWISFLDIENLLHLNGFEVVSVEKRILLPFYIPFFSWFVNRILLTLPLIRNFAIFRLFFIRPVSSWNIQAKQNQRPSVSIIVPCRNEKGNISRCLREMPEFDAPTEVIFVEGGSSDGTREEIQRVLDEYSGPLSLRFFPQRGGSGKGPAVRTGFDEAENDILMILDADLTVRPSELPKFYTALTEGVGDFIMGSRLVYPLEDEAMRTLNILGNKFFSSMFSWILRQPIKDTLCGTKVLWKRDYDRIRNHRDFFGDFDPFGDFDLIFGAALQGFKIMEIPIRYQSRTYGDTNISRFRHGFLLLRMTVFAFIRFRLSL